jgi:hypothetical protein
MRWNVIDGCGKCNWCLGRRKFPNLANKELLEKCNVRRQIEYGSVKARQRRASRLA